MPRTKSQRTLADVEAEIARLKAEAQSIREKEVTGVIARIKEAIAHYGLTAVDLGLAAKRGRKPGTVVAKRGRKAKAKPAKPAGVIKYRDKAGNAWTGRGKRPRWYVEALAAGIPAEDMLVKAGG